MKVGVLMGGISKEREISLKTGKAICEALRKNGENVVAIDCGTELVEQLKSAAIDVAFVALHGAYGEDGCVQGILEWLKIPYTGSGVLASALCMDKAVLNSLARLQGIQLPKEAVLDLRQETLEDFLRGNKIPTLPVIVKPSREGSTINTTIVKRKEELKAAIKTALQSDSKVLIEEFIEGKEVTVAVLNGKALPSIEIIPKSGFYDYQSKYTKGMTEYILPARVSAPCQAEMDRVSHHLYRWIGCAGVVRVDFMVKNDLPYFLEINTMPGMTETSLVPKAAREAGISFEALCAEILKGATLQVGGMK